MMMDITDTLKESRLFQGENNDDNNNNTLWFYQPQDTALTTKWEAGHSAQGL